MNWVIITVLIALAFFFLRVRHIKHKIFLIVIIVVLLFFYTTSSQVLSKHNIDWKSVSGIEKGLKVYFSWLGGALGNLKVLTANAVKMDWSVENSTNGIKVVEGKER